MFKSIPQSTSTTQQEKEERQNSYLPWNDEQILKLWEVAQKEDRRSLMDIMLLGMYTGARIDELHNIQCIHVSNNSLEIPDSKTSSGLRTIPIHSKIQGTIKRLLNDSKDGYLLPSKAKNKYGKRSTAASKEFGNFKTKLGYKKKTHCFHSFRCSLITKFERAKISEVVAARIVGHKIYTMTYGTYSEGLTGEDKKEAIEKIDYPLPHPLK
ncbi:MAG: tyrosine-type recombinase/integrase [Rickettsiales bacterium]|nr:tyrosine-type recombinase/integrase [Rickettsiales bacterium]